MPDASWRTVPGHPAPYGVKYWQIGNEISGEDDNYLDRFHSFVELMKRADPTVAILSSFPSRNCSTAAGREIDLHRAPPLHGRF